ncbi:hypothetical protein CLOP_g5901, partial [Closterium sp. NIES-67]
LPIFPDDLPEGSPPEWPFDHRIELEPGIQPTVQRQFRVTEPDLKELRKQLDYLLEKKYHPPELLAICRPHTIHPQERRRWELINQLRRARLFSKIDLRGGYHQIRVVATDCYKTAFCTRYGSFVYVVMPLVLDERPGDFSDDHEPELQFACG